MFTYIYIYIYINISTCLRPPRHRAVNRSPRTGYPWALLGPLLLPGRKKRRKVTWRTLAPGSQLGFKILIFPENLTKGFCGPLKEPCNPVTWQTAKIIRDTPLLRLLDRLCRPFVFIPLPRSALHTGIYLAVDKSIPVNRSFISGYIFSPRKGYVIFQELPVLRYLHQFVGIRGSNTDGTCW